MRKIAFWKKKSELFIMFPKIISESDGVQKILAIKFWRTLPPVE